MRLEEVENCGSLEEPGCCKLGGKNLIRKFSGSPWTRARGGREAHKAASEFIEYLMSPPPSVAGNRRRVHRRFLPNFFKVPARKKDERRAEPTVVARAKPRRKRERSGGKFPDPRDTKVGGERLGSWIVTGGYLRIKVYLCAALFPARDRRERAKRSITHTVSCGR